MEWAVLAADKEKLEKVRNMALRYIDQLKQEEIHLDKSTVIVCPHENFNAVSTDIPCASQTYDDLICHPWPNNVSLVYEMMDCFNAQTSRLKSLSTPDDELYYDGPLRSFKKEVFECLKNASSVVDLIWKKDKMVQGVVSEIRLV